MRFSFICATSLCDVRYACITPVRAFAIRRLIVTLDCDGKDGAALSAIVSPAITLSLSLYRKSIRMIAQKVASFRPDS
ncbi:hypothetical protein CLDAP_00230 [Caldilinea aerophila DSM 14535 = NBRC 104270]|jgi:hypothetical protein|uniref:Uncharacterized protein n=1 Tax=Caldilinea aerophila (strain DSM 14535 / JCM 11387 / NBRC 104270 / STL-6-O1) TaxID=926550 RepID=I0HYH5_CALAS|nr:hypothetical protein CLDAP_00230 [Caldilinea aerophila DSM 14535 = NBRC 104270]